VISLKDNPHFYDSLPDDKENYNAGFTKRPLLTFNQVAKTVIILVDFGDRILWHFGEVVKVFGNVWKPGDSVIVKGASQRRLVLYDRTH